MEFIEMETKEDIMALAELERAIAPEVMGDKAAEYLENIERDVRFDSEAGAEYYLVYSGGAAGFFSLNNDRRTARAAQAGHLHPERELYQADLRSHSAPHQMLRARLSRSLRGGLYTVGRLL